MKKTAALCMTILLLLCACGKGEEKSAAAMNHAAQTSAKQPIFRTVTPAEAQQMIKTRKDLLLVDVRNQQELREGSIEGSRLLPFWYIAKNNHNLPTDRPLLLICAVGGRSYAAGQILSRRGYNEIYNLQGGIAAWKQAGLPLKY